VLAATKPQHGVPAKLAGRLLLLLLLLLLWVLLLLVDVGVLDSDGVGTCSQVTMMHSKPDQEHKRGGM
jgi:hypothetical protein